jgi:excisionase family DNA binding protein
MVDELDEVYTPKEVAKALKLSEKSVLQYLREGRLPGFRVGKHWRVRHADLAALVQPTPHPVLVAPVDPAEA